MVGEVPSVHPSVCPSVRLSDTLFCAQLHLQFLCDLNQTFTEWLSPSSAAHIVSTLRFHYLSRNYCLLFKFTLSVCPSVTLFCAQLLQFLCDLNQTFTEWLSPRAEAHIVIILKFHYLTRSYCPLFEFTLLRFCAQLLIQFLWDFYETFTEWWSPNAAAHIVRILRFHVLSQSYCSYLNLHFLASVCNSSSSVRNSSYSYYAIWTELSQNYCVQVLQRILSVCVCVCVCVWGGGGGALS